MDANDLVSKKSKKSKSESIEYTILVKETLGDYCLHELQAEDLARMCKFKIYNHGTVILDFSLVRVVTTIFIERFFECMYEDYTWANVVRKCKLINTQKFRMVFFTHMVHVWAYKTDIKYRALVDDGNTRYLMREFVSLVDDSGGPTKSEVLEVVT